MIPIVRFDLARHLRAISTYLYFLILAGIAFLLMITAGGAFQSASVAMGGGKVFVNSPYSLAEFISLLSYFGLLIISAITGKAAFQDFECNTHSFFFTMPIRKSSYLGGRFLGALLILLAIFSGLAFGLAIATKMPFLDKVRIGPNHFWAYVQPFLVSVLPNIFVMGALFFSMAALTRRIAPVYMTSVILLVGYLIAVSISAKLEDKFIAALLDPFGSLAMGRVTEYWTIAEKNSRLVTLEGALLWNRLLWIGLAVALLAFTFVEFKFVYALEGRRAKPAREAASPVTDFAPAAVPGATIPAGPHMTPEFSNALSIRAVA